MVGVLQHRVVVGVDRTVGVDIAVAGVHVQGHEHAAVQHFLVDGGALVQDLLEGGAVEDVAQLGAQLLLPRHADGAVLHHVEHARVRLAHQAVDEVRRHANARQFGQGIGEAVVQMVEQPGPALAHGGQQLRGLLHTVFQDHFGVDGVAAGVVALAHREMAGGEKCGQALGQLQLVLGR